MPVLPWQAVLSTCVLFIVLGGCSGNYTFNDSDYRPLGDPEAVNRGS